ncbi:MAG TPA: VOC family protein [Candidatus Deferrimicrobium sp.]|nr:VOC family protein [Candidatus Deferrimicrobium sp.]
MNNPLKIEAINQIGIVVRDVIKTAKLLEQIFGIGPFQILEREPEEIIYKGKLQNFQIKNGLARVGAVQLELIEVLEGDCCQADFLKRKGEGLHHLGVFVDDLEGALSKAKELGIELLQKGTAAGSIQWAYLDTEETYGLVIEFIQLGKSKKKQK